jgi:peptidoglycan/LPS O-acetylase OafA/YrhL
MEEKATTSGRVNFMNLDLLRFVAAYMIVVLHFLSGWRSNWGNESFLNENGASLPTKLLNTGINNMFFGVDIFFLISGFLITYLLLAERTKTGKVDIWKFYLRRAFRIWPLYFIILMICPIYNYFFDGRTPDLLYMFTFMGNFEMLNGGSMSPATDHLWSICVEEHFYIFCPLLLGLLPWKRIVPALVGVVVMTIIFRYYIYYDESFGINLYLHTLARIDTLAIGALFGYLAFHKKLTFNHSLPVRIMVYSILICIFFTEPLQDYHSAFEAAFKKYIFIIPTAYWMGNFLFHPEAILQPKKINIFHKLGKVSYICTIQF